MQYGADPSGIPTVSPADDGRWAAMAAITFDAVHQTAGRFEAVLIVLRQMLDAIVSHRLRLAAGQGRAMDFFDITMPTHIRGPFKPAPYPSGGRDWAGAGADAHQAMIKRFHLWVFAILLAGSATVGLIALRTAIFVWRFHY